MRRGVVLFYLSCGGFCLFKILGCIIGGCVGLYR
jgi:hypothetical protein